MKITEVRKEDDLYYQGAFWIVANSFKDIMHGQFSLIGNKIPTDFNGNYLEEITSKRALTHKKIWKEQYQKDYEGKSYTYFPRGRVGINNGTAYINVNSKCNTPNVINAVINEYNLSKLEVEVLLDDIIQGPHYNFELE